MLTLEQLSRHVEQRLLAHVDALAVAGPHAEEDLLRPVLAARSRPPRKAAALMALLRMHGVEGVVDALRSMSPGTREAAAWVLGTTAAPLASDWLVEAMDRTDDAGVRPSLLMVAANRALPLSASHVLTSLNAEDPAEIAAAARAARFQDRRAVEGELVRLLEHPVPSVREAALVTALGFKLLQALPCCRAAARDLEHLVPSALLLLALIGEPEDADVLVGHLRHATHRAAALFALGYSGRAAAVEHLLRFVEDDDPTTARLAAEAFSTITGFDASSAEVTIPAPATPLLPPLDEDSASAFRVPDARDELPLVRASAAHAFWRKVRDVDPSKRLLFGRPWDVAWIFELLELAPMRRRHPMGLWLGLQSGWTCRVDTRAFSHVQREQTKAARAAASRLIHARATPGTVARGT